MAGNLNPTPSQILAALRDFGVDIKTYRGWDSVGRPWAGPDGSKGLLGSVVHHTATASAVGSSGCPTLGWAAQPFPGDPLPACNAIVGRGPGDTYLLSAGSAYHCGDGGPFPAIGVSSRGFGGQFRLWGIEIDDPGVSPSSLTDYQIDNTAKMLAAIGQLAGWDQGFSTVVTHKCWTDGCHGVNPNGPSPALGRKNDTLDGAWGQYPVPPGARPYNAEWWRERAKGRLIPPMWDGTVPMRSAVDQARASDAANKATWRLACKLYDVGMWKDSGAKPAKQGVQKYPAASVAAYRGWLGYDGGDSFSARVQKKLFGVDKP